MALARLTGFRDEGVAVPLVLADHWMPGMTGTEFLARVKDVMPTARRGLLTSGVTGRRSGRSGRRWRWGRWSSAVQARLVPGRAVPPGQH